MGLLEYPYQHLPPSNIQDSKSWEGVQNELKNLKKRIKKLETELGRIETHPDASFFKRTLKELNSAILSIRRDVNLELERLRKTETELECYLDETVRDLEEWKIAPPLSQKNKRSPSSKISFSFTAKPEVKRYFDFMKTSGGHAGGWKMKKHIIFLKIRERENFLEAARKQLPEYTKDEILEHEEWFTTYREVYEDYRKAVAKWKSSRLVACQSLDSLPKLTSQKPRPTYKILQWKKEKKIREAADKRQKEEERRTKEFLKKKKIEIEKEKQKEKKMKVAAYQEQKRRRRETDKYIKEEENYVRKKEAAKLANYMLKRHRCEARAHHKKKQEKAAHVKRIRKERRKKETERTEGQVGRWTKAWSARVTADPTPKTQYPLFIRHLKKLKTPQWRLDTSQKTDSVHKIINHEE